MILSSDTHLFRFRGDNINTINELVNNTIWHSKYSGLNDPLELFFDFDKDALRRLSKPDIATIIKKTKYLEENRIAVEICFIKDHLEPIYKYIDNYWLGDVAINMVREFQKNVAVACFTKKHDSRLMWGYYGNGMKGICLAYNKEKLESSGIEYSDVTYTEEVPKINIYKHILEMYRGQDVTINSHFSLFKHFDWQKEEEVRSLKFLKDDEVFENSPGFAVPLENGCIDAVIIGERLAGDMRNFIENFAKKNGIQVLIAKADFKNYKIRIDAK